MVRIKWIIYGTKLMKNVFYEVPREEPCSSLNKLNVHVAVSLHPYGTETVNKAGSFCCC